MMTNNNLPNIHHKNYSTNMFYIPALSCGSIGMLMLPKSNRYYRIGTQQDSYYCRFYSLNLGTADKHPKIGNIPSDSLDIQMSCRKYKHCKKMHRLSKLLIQGKYQMRTENMMKHYSLSNLCQGKESNFILIDNILLSKHHIDSCFCRKNSRKGFSYILHTRLMSSCNIHFRMQRRKRSYGTQSSR